MNTFQKSLLALAFIFCATTALAGYRVQYFVGYGLYPHVATDTTSTEPGTGLLSYRSSGVLVQLIWAGPNVYADPPDPCNYSGGYVSGDDVVLDSRYLIAGTDGVDEWGYTSTLPAPYVSTNSLQKPVYVRVYEDARPNYDLGEWFYTSPLVFPQDVTDSNVHVEDVFATVIHIETGSEAVPASGTLPQQELDPLEPTPHPPCLVNDKSIQQVEFDPEVDGFVFALPAGYALTDVYGADTVLPGGDWNWQTLVRNTHYTYTFTNGVVTLLTTGEGIPAFRIIRLGLSDDF
jgi:hypothetical protein